MRRNKFGWIVALVVSALLVGVDQLLKIWAVRSLQPVGSMDLIKFGDLDILGLHYLENDGAVFSSFSGMRWVLVGSTSIMIAFCIYYLIRHAMHSKLLISGLTLVIAGGIGNLIDRLFRGGLVVDYLEVRLFRFAVFNFADCCVVIGVALLALYFFLPEKKHDAAPKSKDPENKETGDSIDA